MDPCRLRIDDECLHTSTSASKGATDSIGMLPIFAILVILLCNGSRHTIYPTIALEGSVDASQRCPLIDATQVWLPATRCIRSDAAGNPFMEAWRCDTCGAQYLEERIACARCGSADGFTSFTAARRGAIYSYTIVHRSYPGIAVPFISAVVDLDDGLVLKGNLLGVASVPTPSIGRMRVQLIFAEASGVKSPDGRPYLAYFFEPLEITS
jgi:uncharacterized OB-fold protein